MDALVQDPSGNAVPFQEQDAVCARRLRASGRRESARTGADNQYIVTVHHFTSPENNSLPELLYVISSGFT